MSLFEQKLSPIYTCIETENYRQAVKLCQKPDVVNVPIVIALRAYSLAKLYEKDEALSLARSLMKTLPTDSGVLDTLGHVFKACNAEVDMCQCYESAAQVMPDNVEYQVQLFNCYVRLHEHKKMQLVAQKLYKATNSKQYLFWSVSAMLLQKDLLPQMLTVAEKMLSKAMNEPQTAAATVAAKAKAPILVQPGAEELELYVNVLKRANKPEQALAEIEALISSRPNPPPINDNNVFVSHSELVRMHGLRVSDMKIELLQSWIGALTASSSAAVSAPTVSVSELQARLFATVMDQLKEYPDQWSAHQIAIDLVVNSPEVATAVGTHRNYLLSQQTQNPQLRGPYLAEIHLLQRYSAKESLLTLPKGWSAALTAESSSTVSDELVRLLCAYVDRFRTKQCLFSDLRALLSQFSSGKEGVDVLREVGRYCEQQSSVLVVQIQQLAGISPSASAAASLDGQAEEDDNAAADEVEALTISGGKSTSNSTTNSSNSKAKKNKKKKSSSGGGAKKSTSSSSSASSAASVLEERERLVEIMCALCKMEQICVFCNRLMLSSSSSSDCEAVADNSLQNESLRISLYRHTVKRLAAGGIGGDKEVQPGDELLLLCSSARRTRFGRYPLHSVQISSSASSSSSVAESERESESGLYRDCLVQVLVWTAFLQMANVHSPHNYAPRLDLIECYRNLCVGKAALEVYQLLKVRYVQHDSMSYLLIPALLESGLTMECLKQLKAVCYFHSGALRETADMITKCFKHCNYTKALDMQDFLDKCQRSTQLALAKTEIPLLELLENNQSADLAHTYLSKFWGNELQESINEKEHSAIVDLLNSSNSNRFSANFDWTLLIDCENTIDREQAAVQRRLACIADRITWNHRIVLLLSRLLRLKGPLPLSAETEKETDLLRSDLDVLVRLNSNYFAAIDSSSGNDYDANEQRLRTGSNAAFERASRDVVLCMFNIAIAVVSQLDEQSAAETETESDANEVTEKLLSSLAESVAVVRSHLLGEVEPKYVPVSGFSGSVPSRFVHPHYLQRMSSYVRSVCSWSSLAIQALAQRIASISSSNSVSAARVALQSMASLLLGLADESTNDLQSTLSAFDKQSEKALRSALVQATTSTSSFEISSEDVTHVETVVSNLVASQELSVRRMRELTQSLAVEATKAVKSLSK